MTDKAAVIDLGTNTFHILIGEKNPMGELIVIYKERKYVFLGKGGVENIDDDRYLAGILALEYFKEILDAKGISKTVVLGTSALRSATNGPDFVKEVKERTGLEIEVIDGMKEAEYIFKGVLLAKPKDNDNHLIMDIGGGSVEFIIFNNEELIWSRSFKIGISVLYPKFQKHDPLLQEDVGMLDDHLSTVLGPLIEVLKKYRISSLIGASGSFDVLNKLYGNKNVDKTHTIGLDFFQDRLKEIMSMSLDERLKMKNLDPERATLIQIAFYLIHFVLEVSGANQILVSQYAMKEGALNEILD